MQVRTMTKIAIISCIIVAVCVFQTAEAGIFDTSGLDSILGGVKSGVTDARGNVNNAEQEVENRGKGLISDIQNKLESSKSQLQNSTGCKKLYSDAQQMSNNLIAVFKTCISNETQTYSTDIQKLSDTVNNLTSLLGKGFQDIANCTQKLVTPWEITQIGQCFSTNTQDHFKILLKMWEAVLDANELVKIFPSMGTCFVSTVLQLISSNADKLIKDVQQCYT
ncbi:uncharacterized protein LOC143895531 [Temnothorax americanus]|uniref:uncharacterized protein LOC143895531 n=1 Tax=Temnothorax americanus TaxID=1964332 RepID=UPI004067CB23